MTVQAQALDLATSPERPGLRAWLRIQAELRSARSHHARTFYELDPATDHWRRL